MTSTPTNLSDLSNREVGANVPAARFEPFSQLFRQALDRRGQPDLPVGMHSPGHIAATDEQARDEFWPHYLEVIRNVSKTRGFVVPTKESFLHETGPHGALYVGSPATVAREIAVNLPALGAARFDLKYGMGGLSPKALMTNIELYGTQVVPRVRELLADTPVAAELTLSSEPSRQRDRGHRDRSA